MVSTCPPLKDIFAASLTCIPAHLVLITFVPQVSNQTLYAFRCRALPIGPSVWAERLVPAQRRPHSYHISAASKTNKTSKAAPRENVQSGTSGGRFHICGGMQIQLAGLLGAPSDRGTSPDGAPAHRQSVLWSTRGHLKGHGVKPKLSEHRGSPGCLASLGLMQRTYQGCLDRRISVSPFRLFLN